MKTIVLSLFLCYLTTINAKFEDDEHHYNCHYELSYIQYVFNRMHLPSLFVIKLFEPEDDYKDYPMGGYLQIHQCGRLKHFFCCPCKCRQHH